MPYASERDLPDTVRNALPSQAQSIWRNAYNSANAAGKNEEEAAKIAWGAIENAGWRKEGDEWVKKYQQVAKVDADRNLVFGWAYVSVRRDGRQVIDHSEEIVEIGELEDAAYLFNLEFRGGGIMHEGDTVGRLVESFVSTPEKLEKMGLQGDALPMGWWVGFYIEDDAVFAEVKDGTYSMFSIQGRAVREEVA